MIGVNMKTIGLVPGGMKPFHAGHNFILQEALRECDEVILFTTVKDRGVIKGENMKRAWLDLIKPLLPGLGAVTFVKSPIGAVYQYLEDEGLPENEYRIYGGTEEVNRFKPSYLAKNYPDLTIVQPAAEDPIKYDRSTATGVPVSGTKTRKAIEAGNFQLFKSYLPKFLKPHAREYLDILMS